MKPIFVINFKTYKQGKEVLRLVNEIYTFFNKKTYQDVFKEIIIGVQATDLYEVNEYLINKKKSNIKNKIKIFVQHVDFFKKGRVTGFILPEAVKEDGAKGTFINHSEHVLKLRIIKKTIKRCKKNNLKTMVFVPDLKFAKKVQRFKIKPDYLVFEPPKLVAGRKSVSKAKPELIKEFKDKIKMDFIVGAGIKNSEDIKKAIELGSSGVAVASAITKSKNINEVLKKLCKI